MMSYEATADIEGAERPALVAQWPTIHAIAE
jgi:hypothetical protein